MIRRDFVKSSLAMAALAAGSEGLAASPRARAAESAPFPKAPGLTKYVSEFIVNTKYPDSPADVVELGRKSILDGFAAQLHDVRRNIRVFRGVGTQIYSGWFWTGAGGLGLRHGSAGAAVSARTRS